MKARTTKLSLVGWQLRTEGWRAVRDRLMDRWADHRAERSCFATSRGATGRDGAAIKVLNLLPTAPWRRLGGVQVQFLARSEHATQPRALLYPGPDGWCLVHDQHPDGIETLPGPVPDALSLRSPGFVEMVEHALRKVRADLLHVESATGLPVADLAAIAGKIPTVVGCHDMGSWCFRPHLLEQPSHRFCDYSADPNRCARCLAQSWSLHPSALARHRAANANLLESAAAVVYPSPFLHRVHANLYPDRRRGTEHVVPPARFIAARRTRRRRRGTSPSGCVAFIGGNAIHKGAGVLRRVVRSINAPHPRARFRVYGPIDPGGDPLADLEGLEIRGYYPVGHLPELLIKDRVSVALCLSIVPESYGLAVDECLAAGVPVVTFDHGAPADRIRRIPNAGWVVPEEEGAARIVGILERLLALPSIPSPDPACPLPSDPRRSAAAMEAVYRRLGRRGSRKASYESS